MCDGPAAAARRGARPGGRRRRARRRRRGRLRPAHRVRSRHLVGRRGRNDDARAARQAGVAGARRGRRRRGRGAVCVLVSLRAVGRLSPRALLTAQSLDASTRRPDRAPRAGATGLLAALCARRSGSCCWSSGSPCRRAQAGAFFGAGAALLVGALLWLAGWLRARDARPIAGRGAWAVARLGFRSAAFRPARSVLSAALIASAAFIIVSVDAFRREGGELTPDPKSGTGGYVLFAEVGAAAAAQSRTSRAAARRC